LDLRIRDHPILEFERGEEIRFYFDGNEILAYEGETIGAALFAAGVDVFTRSVKYHRPRGMFCAIGKCSSCMMRVDGVPNTMICIVPLRDGMVVESQNAFPSIDVDVLSLFSRFFPSEAGFYYRMLTRPRSASSAGSSLQRQASTIECSPALGSSTRST
jgi:sarcosine oxidase subunit alpha